MTETVLGLSATALSADKIRSNTHGLRLCLTEMAKRGHDVWTGPLDSVVEVLHELGRVDLCLARLAEGHCDALRIIDEAGAQPGEGVYAVWASRSVGTGLRAAHLDGEWQVSGELRFASGADLVDRALVPMSRSDEHGYLMDVPADLGDVDESVWQTCGMDAARTFTIQVDTTLSDVKQVGPPDFYLQRPGFAVGGLRVAAVWAGGARQLLDVVATAVRQFPTSPHQLRRLGQLDEAVWRARAAVDVTVSRLGLLAEQDAAREIDRARTTVVQACEHALADAVTIVGPAGLSRNQRLSRIVQDLTIYIRQHHVDGVLARLGEQALAEPELLAG